MTVPSTHFLGAFCPRSGAFDRALARVLTLLILAIAAIGFGGCNAASAGPLSPTLTLTDSEAMAYPAEHTATLTDADSHTDLDREEGEFGQGIDVVYGINSEPGPRDGKTEVHKIIFDDRLYTPDGAKEWLDDNDYGDYDDFTEAPRENPEQERRDQATLNVLRQHRRAFESTGSSTKARAAEVIAERLAAVPGVETEHYGDDTEAIVLVMAPTEDSLGRVEKMVERGEAGRVVEYTHRPGLYRGTRWTIEKRVDGETVPVRLLTTTARQSLIATAAWTPYYQQKADTSAIEKLQDGAEKADRGECRAVDETLTDADRLRDAVWREDPGFLSRTTKRLMQSDAMARVAGYAGGIAAAGTIALAARYASKYAPSA